MSDFSFLLQNLKILRKSDGELNQPNQMWTTFINSNFLIHFLDLILKTFDILFRLFSRNKMYNILKIYMCLA